MQRSNAIKAAVMGAFSLLLTITWDPCAAESLYEYYTAATEETLRSETKDMGGRLAKVFNEDSVARRQQQIDFSEYVSNLRKAVLFAGKLATYSEYEKDLQFARDKEIFKGLPDNQTPRPAGDPALDKKQYAEKKYQSMSRNVQEEIETYRDLIQIALDACEMLTGNDLSGMLENAALGEKIKAFKDSDVFSRYMAQRPLFLQK